MYAIRSYYERYCRPTYQYQHQLKHHPQYQSYHLSAYRSLTYILKKAKRMITFPPLHRITSYNVCYTKLLRLIEDNRAKVEALAAALLEWETLDSEQIGDIMAGNAPRPPKQPSPPSSTGTPSGGPQGATAPATP